MGTVLRVLAFVLWALAVLALMAVRGDGDRPPRDRVGAALGVFATTCGLATVVMLT